MVEMDLDRLDSFVLTRDMVDMVCGRLDNFVLLRNMVGLDFLIDWTVLYYFVTW